MGLTAKEVTTLNKITRNWDKSGQFNLGTKLQALLADVINGTPVNAVNATGLLTLTGVAKDGETVTINNPGKIGSDVYEFLSDALQTKSSPNNKAVDITATTVKATGTLTIVAQPTVGDTFTIGANVYIFVSAGEADVAGEVSVGTDLASAKAAIVAAINGTDGRNLPHPLVSAADFAVNDCVITAFVGGTIGNTISTIETFTNAGNVFSAGTLLNGADCSAANAVTALVAAINEQDTQDVSAAPGTGTKVALTADIAGISGNEISTTDTMALGSFGGAKLTGGIDGTVGTVAGLMIDTSYVYFCIADNSISGKNWRRISLGSAF